MRAQLLKPLRLVISLLFLAATGFAFLDYSGLLSSSQIRAITWIQFVPSLLSFLSLPALLSLGFLAVLVLTLLFGRVYCSTVCPLGILQDVIAWFLRLGGRRRHHPPARPRNLVRYTILGITVVVTLAGSVLMLNLLDPFSLFGKIVAGLGRPVFFALNNVAADLLQVFGNYALHHVETHQSNMLALAFPAGMLALITVLSVTHGRLYCNTVCPLGSFLGLLAKGALFRIEIDDARCTQCARCSLHCKAQCIDLEHHRIDPSRCVGCFNCLEVCSRQGIGYRHRWAAAGRPQAESEPAPDANQARFCQARLPLPAAGRPMRRYVISSMVAFLLGRFLVFGKVRAASLLKPDTWGESGVIAVKQSTIPEDKHLPICPPGSRELTHFTGSCTACQLCVAACPTRVLQPAFLEYGITGMMQPRLDYHANFCQFDCVRCGEVCPTGAIRPLALEDKHLTRIGVVRLELGNCVVKTEGTACGACAEHCPTQAVRMVPCRNGLTVPEIHESQCVGCGACEYICPVRPYRAIYVDGVATHEEADPPVIVAPDFVLPEEDFPF